MKRAGNRGARILAWLIDLVVFLPPAVLLIMIAQLPFWGSLSMLLIIIASVAHSVFFLMRDYLFYGSSIGKRLFRLRVVDTDTLDEPSPKQLIVKNLFQFLGFFDGLFLLISGWSLGERSTNTAVVHNSKLPQSDADRKSVQLKGKRIIVVAITVLCISILMFSVMMVALNDAKKQPNYQVAYAYLLNSKAYAETRSEQADIVLVGYRSGITDANECDSTFNVESFTFMVSGRQFEVVLHENGGAWCICLECTHFQ